MNAPFVWILASGLVPEKAFKEVLSKRRVRVEEDRPRWEDDIDSVHVLSLREKIGLAHSRTSIRRCTYPVARNLCVLE